MIGPHTGEAGGVYEKDRNETKDGSMTESISTASPYKFTRSVMNAIDSKDHREEDFALADMLSQRSGVRLPMAVEEIRTAPILHTRVCEKNEMKQTVREILGL